MKILSVLTISSALLGTATAFVSPQRAATTATALDATIAVFGASGLTASECVYQALRDGDTVVGLTRNPSKLVVPKGSGGKDAEKPLYDHPNLTLIGGDVTNPADVAKGKKGWRSGGDDERGGRNGVDLDGMDPESESSLYFESHLVGSHTVVLTCEYCSSRSGGTTSEERIFFQRRFFPSNLS
jgi:hypothetical protein